MIKVTNLTKHFDKVIAVDSISFEIRPGEICGYLGPNGAGKTTTIKMLTGLLKIDSGSAVLNDISIEKNYPIELKKQIGYVPESGEMYSQLTSSEYLTFMGNLYHLDEDKIKNKLEKFFNYFEITNFKNTRISSLSKGTKQKVLIITALLHNPDILLLDEPLSGIDVRSQLLIKNLIKELAESGKTIFYSSHILEVVENLCDRVIIINEGKIVADEKIQKLKDLSQQKSLEEIFSKLVNINNIESVTRELSDLIKDDE